MGLRHIAGLLVVGVLFAPQEITWAQRELAFEVTSVRENASTDPPTPASFGLALAQPPGRVVLRNWTLRALIAHAYGLASSFGEALTLRGGSDHILDRRFDITARLAPGVRSVSVDEERAMLRTLLKDRFGLTVHVERHDVPVLALRRPGEFGPGLRSLEVDCATWRAARLSRPLDGEGNQICMTRTAFVPPGAGFQVVDNGDIARVIWWVQQYVDRPVVDETGLSGSFAFDLTFALPVAGTAVRVDSHPSIFTALEEQLGLTLVPTEAPMEVVVIDAVSLPEPN